MLFGLPGIQKKITTNHDYQPKYKHFFIDEKDSQKNYKVPTAILYHKKNDKHNLKGKLYFVLEDFARQIFLVQSKFCLYNEQKYVCLKLITKLKD
jgi:hypothetical protein